ncbi:MAG: hypothetical protein AB1445_12715 [Bacillota bacterium]
MRPNIGRRTAGRVMLLLGVTLAASTFAQLPQILPGPRGAKFLAGTALLLAAGWIHAGLATPRLERSPWKALLFLGAASLLLAWRWVATGGNPLFSVVLVGASAYGVVGLGWGHDRG